MGLTRPLLVTVAFLASLSAAGAAPSRFAGTWEMLRQCPQQEDPVCQEDAFSIRLLVKKHSICGTHSAIAKGGNKVDEMGGTQPSLLGTFAGNMAIVTFSSSFAGTGQARLIRHGRDLRWQLIEAEGEHWLPAEANLRRVRNSRWGAGLKCDFAAVPASPDGGVRLPGAAP